ncbi:hypothetical protein C7B09_17650 [Escherichia albertii]|uniref:Uncharacterized protein n=1 Tax=Escherichia albertii TaxID=208962 RepID=A0ABX5HFT6_ESCAL|nr:hypothetical protein C7B09_17650 [Escherichia albertii]
MKNTKKIHLITEIDKDILFILDESEGNVAGPDQVVIDTFDIWLFCTYAAYWQCGRIRFCTFT